MKKSRVCALGLACFLSAVTAFSALAATSGGGALLRNLSDNSAHSEASLSGQNAAQNLTPQEQLLAGTLELDPENDPVIYTTESGLEIKYAQAINLGSGDKHTSSGTIGGVATIPSGLSGYAYISLGTYDNKPINWIIIGYNSSSTTVNVNYNFDAAVAFSTYLANPSAYNSFAGSLETSTDAGSLISNAANNGLVYGKWALSVALDYSLAVNAASKGLTELSSGEVLVLCEGNTGSSWFKNGDSVYSSSDLQTAMRNLYYPETGKNGAEFTEVEAALIVPKTLTTASSDSLTEYLFPLGSSKRASTESFAVENYLNSDAKRNIGANWWLRSRNTANSTFAYLVLADGVVSYGGTPFSQGVRPAMVLQIT